MKLSCEIIKDMLPLYCDSICSEETKAAVEEHLTDCTSCSEELKKMKSNLPVTVLRKEEGGFIIGRYKMNLIRKFLILSLCVFVLPLINSFISRIYADDISEFSFFITAAVLIPNVYIQKIKAKDSPTRICAYSILFTALMIVSVLNMLGFQLFSDYPFNYRYYTLGNLILFVPIIIYSVICVALYVLRFKKEPLPPLQYKKTVTAFLIYETEILLYLRFMSIFKNMSEPEPFFGDILLTATAFTFRGVALTAFTLAFIWLGYLFFKRFKRKNVFNIGVCITASGIFIPTYTAIYEMVRHNSFHAAAAFWNANFLDSNNPANFFMQILIILCMIGASLILIGILTEKSSAKSEQPNQLEQSEHKEEEEEHEEKEKEQEQEQDQKQEEEEEERQEEEEEERQEEEEEERQEEEEEEEKEEEKRQEEEQE